MKIRTYYWHDRLISPQHVYIRRALGLSLQRHFVEGNAGDILVRDLLAWKYGKESVNTKRGGRRLLVIGSIGHRVQPGDIVCGIGVKTRHLPQARGEKVHLLGLRGPLTLEVFKKAGYDDSNLRFLMDPGLLIRFMTDEIALGAKPGGAIFIPHYRERGKYRKGLGKGIRFVDIDAPPLSIARQILLSELVYASSLHGIVFAHALNRPAVLVSPQTEEPMLKYEDYYLSINQEPPRPLEDISHADFASAPNSPLDLKYRLDDFAFPTVDFLRDAGILV